MTCWPSGSASSAFERSRRAGCASDCVAVGALDVHLGLDDRHQAVGEHLLGDLELLRDDRGDARVVGEVDDRTLLGAEHAERLGRGRAARRGPGIGFISWTPLASSSSPLSILMNGTTPRSISACGAGLPSTVAVHRPLEQDRADHLAAAEAGRGDDPRAHLVDQAEHLLVVRPCVVLDAIALERLGRRSALLVERGDEAAARRRSCRASCRHRSFGPILCCSSAATPGSVRPSIHSRNAPPAVETKVKSLGHAGVVERGDGVAAAGDRDQAAVLGQRRGGLAPARPSPHRTAASRTRRAARSRPACGNS